MIAEKNIKLCPCCSGKQYEECCKVFHDGAKPQNALQLMRSRYAAYALNIPDYIMKTTHPENPLFSKDKLLWKEKISQFSRNTSFQKLEILDFKEKIKLSHRNFYCSFVTKWPKCYFYRKK